MHCSGSKDDDSNGSTDGSSSTEIEDYGRNDLMSQLTSHPVTSSVSIEGNPGLEASDSIPPVSQSPDNCSIGLEDLKIDDAFLSKFEPDVQSKLKLITAAHESAKKYLDITVSALSNQKQYLKYMTEQNKEYQEKLETLEAELKHEQQLKDQAEKDIEMWKGECHKAEVTFNKIKSRKKLIASNLQQMYDRYDVLVSENESLRRLVDNLSANVEHKSHSYLPARKPKQAKKSNLVDAKSETTVTLPPINKLEHAKSQPKMKQSGLTTLPPILPERNRYLDGAEASTSASLSTTTSSFRTRTPTPWRKRRNNRNNSCSVLREGGKWYQRFGQS